MTDTTFATCKCGCNEAVSAKALYRPGHDARHVSHLLNILKERGEFSHTYAVELSKYLPSAALKAKFMAAANRHQGIPMTAPTNRETKDEGQRLEGSNGETFEVLRITEIPDVKIGRWFYPARELHTENGIETQRNEKRDGSGEWLVY